MKRYILLLFLIGTTMVSFGQNSEDTKPKFKFEKELINYGKVVQNSNGNRIFTDLQIQVKVHLFIKETLKPRVIVQVPKKPTDPIMPGGKEVLRFLMTPSKRLEGFLNRLLFFRTLKKP